MKLFPASHLPERLLAELGDRSVAEADLPDRDRGHLEACERCRRLRDGHGIAARLLASPWSVVAVPATASVVRLAPIARVTSPTARQRSRLTLLIAIAALILTVVVTYLAAFAGSRPPSTPDDVLGVIDASATPAYRDVPSTARPLATAAPTTQPIVVITPSPRADICDLLTRDDVALLLIDRDPPISAGSSFGGGNFPGRGDGCVYGMSSADRPGQYKGVRVQLEIKAVGGSEDDAKQGFADDLATTDRNTRTTVKGLGDQAVIASGWYGKSGYIYRNGENSSMDWEQVAVIRVRKGTTYFEISVRRIGEGGAVKWSPNSALARRLPTDHELLTIARRVLRRLDA